MRENHNTKHINTVDTVINTPSSRMTKNIWDGNSVTDSLGRVIHLRNPNILDMYDLRKALGEDGDNSGCFMMMHWVLYVKKIDSLDFDLPKTHGEARLSLKLLGIEGINALQNYMSSNETNVDQGIEEVKK